MRDSVRRKSLLDVCGAGEEHHETTTGLVVVHPPAPAFLPTVRDPGGGRRAARAGDEHLEALRSAPAAEGSRRPGRQGQVGDLHLPLRRAGAARQLRPEARRPRRHPRRVQADRHAARRASRSASTCRELAQRSHLWALVRSLTHPSNDHSAGHHIMLTGRSDLPAGFTRTSPKPTDWPSIAAVAGSDDAGRGTTCRRRSSCPRSSSTTPAASSPASSPAMMGPRRDPWFIEASPFDPTAYGAYPEYEFDHQERPEQVEGAALPGPEPDACPRASGPTGSATAWTCWSRSTASAATSSGRGDRAVRPLPPGGGLAADRPAGPAGVRRRSTPTRRPSTATAATRSAGRC